jgi:hypothetical protein
LLSAGHRADLFSILADGVTGAEAALLLEELVAAQAALGRIEKDDPKPEEA